MANSTRRPARQSANPLLSKSLNAAPTLTEADGRQLAVDMLRDLGDRWNDQEGLDADGEPSEVTEALMNREPDILRRYLGQVHARNSPQVERGFLCVLSEYIGSAVEGAPLDLDAYDQHVDRRRGCQKA